MTVPTREPNGPLERGKYVEYAQARETSLHYAANLVSALERPLDGVVPLAESFLAFLIAGPAGTN